MIILEKEYKDEILETLLVALESEDEPERENDYVLELEDKSKITVDLEEIEQSEWEVVHKYQTKETIMAVILKGIIIGYVSINECRSGSPFSDYHYEDPEFCIVDKVEEVKVVTTWKARQ